MENFGYCSDSHELKVSHNGSTLYNGAGVTTGIVDDGTNQEPKKVISVIGSGDYGRAISGRLVKSGYSVFIGSRDPNKNMIKQMVRQTGATLVNQESAVSCSDLIIIAVGRDHYDHLPIASLKGKILVDVSNNQQRRKGPHYRSNAEYLQGLVPEARVVKGFNVLSAYTLENGGLQGNKEVYIASDYPDAKAHLSDVIRTMGFTSVDWGSITASRDIEDVPLKLMPSWRRPVLVVFGVFIFVWFLTFLMLQVCANAMSGDWSANWQNISMVNFNRVLGVTSLWVLSFCYLPGIFAAYIQLWRGTKYSRFPQCLDRWLRMRKQLGLLMMGMASLHAIISAVYLSPQVNPWFYEDAKQFSVPTLEGNETKSQQISLLNWEFNWRGQLSISCAGVATCLIIVLGITSLPSVTATMSWREFTFVQSKLGWVALIASALHDTFMAWHWMFLYWGCFNTMPIAPQFALYPPVLCVVLKFPLLLPPIDTHLTRIRNGFSRKNCSRTSKSGNA